MDSICRMSLSELSQNIQDRELKVREVVQSYLERIDATEADVSALLNINREQSLEQAEDMDKRGPEREKPLWGVPAVIKDVLASSGITTTCGSNMLKDFVPFYDADCVRRLKNAGALILGKSNMDEFAMGSSTENSAFFPTKNPWNLQKVPGGSSGGSAASVAAYQCPFALGTDTGGSIRQPASFCGLVGLKPTYGRVSRFGLVAYGSSLDQAGPMTRSVRDAAMVMQEIAGHDHKDSTSSPVEVPDYLAALGKREDLQGIKLGVPEEYWTEGLSPEVEEKCKGVLDLARDLGAEVRPVKLPYSPYAIATYYIIVMAEASSNLARYDGVRYGWREREVSDLIEMYTRNRSQGFGNEVQRRIILGTYVLSSGYYDAYYKKAAQARRLIRDDFLQALSECDLLCAPVAPSTAFNLGEKTQDPLQMYLTDVFTNSLNLTGLPGLSLPAGLGSESGMPVGIQFFGPSFGEDLLLQVGHTLETNLPHLPEPMGI
ncbi:MAG: Asp-tRNA(Asn)/Glu-tRNA(Gln) amidotransferase subunit GatA [Thermodesulfobacteriota bacterium]